MNVRRWIVYSVLVGLGLLLTFVGIISVANTCRTEVPAPATYCGIVELTPGNSTTVKSPIGDYTFTTVGASGWLITTVFVYKAGSLKGIRNLHLNGEDFFTPVDELLIEEHNDKVFIRYPQQWIGYNN